MQFARSAAGWLLLLMLGPQVAAIAAGNDVDDYDWFESRSGHFRVVSNAEREDVREFARRLETLRALLDRVLSTRGAAKPGLRTTVLYFRDADSAQRIGLLAEKVGGSFRKTLSGNVISALRGASALEAVGHEYAHYVLSLADTGYPAWYDEGLAEVAGSPVIAPESAILGPPLAGRLGVLRRAKSLLPLEELMTTHSPWRLGGSDRTSLFYAQAWLLTHYFTFGARADLPDRSASLDQYLALLKRDVEPGKAVGDAFGVDFAGLDRELAAYLALDELPRVGVSLESIEVLPVEAMRKLPLDEAVANVARLRLDVLRGEDSSKERRYTRRMLTAAKRANRENARILACLAQTSMTEREARRSFENAIELEPDDSWVRGDYAMWLLDRHDDESTGSNGKATEELREAASQFASLVELAPSLPLGHAGLGLVGLAAASGDAEAITHLERARTLQPGGDDQDFTISFALGALYRRAARPADARASYEFVERRSHSEDAAERARAAIRALEEGSGS